MLTKKIKDFFPGNEIAMAVLILAALKFFIHFIINVSGGYGFFRDEFYYIACSNHLAVGYVDQPPFSIFLLWLSRTLFGDSLAAVRLFAALAGALTIYFTGLITREMGGGKHAQALAAVAAFVSPTYMAMNSYFSMNSFDILLWCMAFHRFLLILKNDTLRNWIILGLILGLGLLNKISVLWLIAGLLGGTLLTEHRRKLLSLNLLSSALIVALLFLPHIIWQFTNDFPTLEFIKNASSQKYKANSPVNLFLSQIPDMNPLAFPVWFAGLITLLISKNLKSYKILAFVYLIVFIILSVNKTSKAEYLSPAYTALFAGGGIAWESLLKRFNFAWLKFSVPAILLLSGMLISPLVLPVLPVESYIQYAAALGQKPSTPEKKALSRLPQFYADMFGWEDLVKEISRAYETLSPEEKKKCAIITNNYGEAGAVDYFGPKYNLPRAICGHNNYWLWGCRGNTGEVVIRLNIPMEAILESYKSARISGTFKNDYCMPYENNMSIIICFQRTRSLTDDWKEFRHYE